MDDIDLERPRFNVFVGMYYKDVSWQHSRKTNSMAHGYTIEVPRRFVKEKHVLVMFEVISCSEEGNEPLPPNKRYLPWSRKVLTKSSAKACPARWFASWCSAAATHVAWPEGTKNRPNVKVTWIHHLQKLSRTPWEHPNPVYITLWHLPNLLTFWTHP